MDIQYDKVEVKKAITDFQNPNTDNTEVKSKQVLTLAIQKSTFLTIIQLINIKNIPGLLGRGRSCIRRTVHRPKFNRSIRWLEIRTHWKLSSLISFIGRLLITSSKCLSSHRIDLFEQWAGAPSC